MISNPKSESENWTVLLKTENAETGQILMLTSAISDRRSAILEHPCALILINIFEWTPPIDRRYRVKDVPDCGSGDR
jgi:hypothetical protein